jgi:hypothetical protein
MLFQHTVDKVLSGEKTQTRRLIKANDKTRRDWHTLYAITKNRPLREIIQYCSPGDVGRVSSSDGILVEWTPKFLIGKTYAVQPGRGQKAVGRIRITGIRCEDVREISAEDVRAEGFNDTFHFLWTWTQMHDKPAWNANQNTDFSDGDESGWGSHPEMWVSWLKGTRPAERYQAWVLEFELVDDGA